MDLNKKNMKRIALLIAFGLLLYWGLNHPGQAGQMLSTVFSIFLPFLLGGCLAFLLNVILRPVERGWRRAWGKRYGPRQKRAQRPVCLLVSTLLLVGVVFAIFFIVVPALKDSVVNFVSLLPSRLTHLEHWWNNLAGFLEAHSIQLPEFSLNSAELQNNITSFLSKYGEDFLNTTIGITSSIFSLVVNLVLALAFSLYLLAQKETLTGQAKKVVRALFSEKWAHWITDVARMTNRTFSNFVTGQLIEACILGGLCAAGMLFIQADYAPLIGVIIGASAIIPVAGAYIGAIVSALLLVMVSPIKALVFLVFLVVLQQIEGNVIYPKVVGTSIGLPGIWVLAAVTIGGGVGGLVGVLLSVPVASVLYALLRRDVHKRLACKE